MVTPLTPTDAQMMRDVWSNAELLYRLNRGIITQEHYAQILAVGVSEAIPTVSDVVDAVGTNARNNADFVLSFIDTASAYTGDTADGMSDEIRAYIDSFLEPWGQDLTYIEQQVYGVVEGANAAVAEAVLDIEEAWQGVPRATVQGVSLLLDDTEQGILDYLEAGLSLVTDNLSGAVSTIGAEIEGQLDIVQDLSGQVIDQATGFATALRDSVPEIGTAIVDGMAGLGDAVTSGFGSAFSAVIDTLGADKLLSVFSLLGAIGGQIDKELGGLDDLEVREGSWAAPLSTTDAINTVLGSVPWVGNVIHTKHPAEFERIRLASPAWVRPTPLDTGSTLEFIRRYPETENGMRVNLERAGLSDERIDQLLNIRFNPLSLAENVAALRRGFIDPNTFEANLRALSLSDEDIDVANKLSYQLPPIGDLIRMVVRDVFDPTVVEQGGFRDDIDTFPFEIADQMGLDREWAERYWMAHWVLPSINQGFEMLHRGEIDDDGLEALFKAADIAPGYKDELKAIAYRSFTRVDTRRMNLFLADFGPAQVKRSYKDLGYDDEKAQVLTDFTIAYNDNVRAGSKSKERDLTKSDIIGAYNDGVLDAAETGRYLLALGYDDAEVTVLIEREDTQAMMAERKADIRNIVEQAKIKALTYEEAQDRLAALDLTRTETNKALADLARATEARTRTPAKSDLDNWLDMGLITEGDYGEELRTLGYADRYVDLYVEATKAELESDLLAQEEREARRREPRSVSKGNLDSLYQAEIIDADGYREGLTVLGYREQDITNLLTQQTIRLEERQRAEIERLERGEEVTIRERLPSRAVLGKLFIKGLIDLDAYRDGLGLLGFSAENIELLSKLIGAKVAEIASEQT